MEKWSRTTGKVNEKWYYMDSNGVMRTNSLIDDTYYVNSSGEMVLNEWRELSDNWDHEGGWRYFGANGKAYENGWKQIHDVWYYFNNSVMATGWQDLDGDIYYLGSSGAGSGWKQLPDPQQMTGVSTGSISAQWQDGAGDRKEHRRHRLYL